MGIQKTTVCIIDSLSCVKPKVKVDIHVQDSEYQALKTISHVSFVFPTSAVKDKLPKDLDSDSTSNLGIMSEYFIRVYICSPLGITHTGGTRSTASISTKQPLQFCMPKLAPFQKDVLHLQVNLFQRLLRRFNWLEFIS